jgi:general secretion pathway protein J
MSRRRAAGFTLLELLVALAIFAVLATIAYGALNSVLTARRAVEAKGERLAALQTALMVMERDVEQAVPREVRDEFGDRQPALIGGGTGTAVLALTRDGWRNPLGLARSNLQRVAYAFNDGRLLRASWSILDRAPDSQPYSEVLLDKVTAVDVRFLGADGQWSGYWPQQTAAGQAAGAQIALAMPPPRAVEVSLDVEGWGRITRLFRVPG